MDTLVQLSEVMLAIGGGGGQVHGLGLQTCQCVPATESGVTMREEVS